MNRASAVVNDLYDLAAGPRDPHRYYHESFRGERPATPHVPEGVGKGRRTSLERISHPPEFVLTACPCTPPNARHPYFRLLPFDQLKDQPPCSKDHVDPKRYPSGTYTSPT